MIKPQTRYNLTFYDDRSHLEECVSPYAIARLHADDTIVPILNGRSSYTVTTMLSSHGFVVADLVENGRVTLFDADDTLAKIDGAAGFDWAAVTSLANDLVDPRQRPDAPSCCSGRWVTLWGTMGELTRRWI